MLTINKIQLDKFFINGDYINFPVKYLAYIDNEGNIKNLNGDIYNKNSKNTYTLEEIDIANSFYYDLVLLGKLIDEDMNIIDPMTFIFLVNNTLYDIYGNEIIIRDDDRDDDSNNNIDNNTKETNDDSDDQNSSNNLSNLIKCNYINCNFNNNVDDEYNNISFFINGNKNFDNGFIFDGNTYLLSNLAKLTDEWTMCFIFQTNSSNVQSLISFSDNGNNLFNVLIDGNNIYIVYNDSKYLIGSIDDNIQKLIVNSNGDILFNNIKKNIGKIDLSTGNWNFILGGDYNQDKSVNNFFIGKLMKFGVCNSAFIENIDCEN